ncbi:MAG: ATP-dependent Clp protease adaptor ClpS [Flavobacteriales bacterium]|nr:ATP-dependent Clp protease adaptor ClpS [Flavobacteriales bacterium]
MDTEHQIEELLAPSTETLTERAREIILHNDDVNTFEHVIVSLMEICDHDPIQAEQCAMLVHYNGKCSVKRGSFEVLTPMRTALCDRGLSADIQ